MIGLVEFLRARLAEEEAIARDADIGPLAGVMRMLGGPMPGPWVSVLPQRVFVEVDAVRRIIEAHRPVEKRWTDGTVTRPCECQCPDCAGPDDQWPCTTMRLIALPYADHPDYREEWRP